MSTLKVDGIRHNNATSDAITMASDGTCTAKLTSINDGALSNRNLLHNSSFEVWQRGTTSASAASGGNRCTADRWSVPNRTRVAQSTDVPAGFKYAILLDREQTGGSEPFTLHQGIEKDNIRQTGSYTLSFYAKSSDINSVNINVQDRTTVAEGGTNHSSIVTNQAVTITSSWARYTYTFTLSSIALSGTCLRISIGNTSANQNDELLLTGIQLETGTTATDIEKRSLGHELSLCQRYFAIFPGRSGGVPFWQAYMGASYGYCSLPIPFSMRAVPSPTDPSTGTTTSSGHIYDASGNQITGNFGGQATTLSCAGYAPSGLAIIMSFGNHSSGNKNGVVASWNGGSPGIYLDAEL